MARSFILGERFKKLQEKQSVKALNEEALEIKDLVVRGISLMKKSRALTDNEKKHLENLKEMEGHEFIDDKALIKKGLVTKQAIDAIRKSIDEINEIEILEEREKSVIVDIVVVLERLEQALENVLWNISLIASLVYHYSQLESSYLFIQRQIMARMHKEEVVLGKKREKKELKKALSDEQSKKRLDHNFHATLFLERCRSFGSDLTKELTGKNKDAGALGAKELAAGANEGLKKLMRML